MRKRILAICLAAALMIGMLPAITLTIGAETETAEPAYQAAYAEMVSADGQLTEAQWLTDGYLSDGRRFGALWDGENLYLAVKDAQGETLSVALGDKEFSFEADGTTEVKISFVDFGLTLHDYSQTVPMKLVLGGASWEGELHFSALERSSHAASYLTGEQVNWVGADYPSLGSESAVGGYRVYHEYLADGQNTSNGRIYVYTPMKSVTPFQDRSKTVTVEFDVLIEKMPEYGTTPLSNAFVCYGMNFVMQDFEGAGIVAGITNAEDGLHFILRGSGSPAYTTVKLNKTLGQQFHLRLDWKPDGDLGLYVDGVLLQTVEGAEMDGDTMKALTWTGVGFVQFNYWGNGTIPTSEADEVDFTFTDLRFGATPYTSALDTLDFADIQGENTDAVSVMKDLTLPETWTCGQLQAGQMAWSSSEPDIVDPNTGSVTLPDVNTEVTLTASLEQLPEVTKDITFTVRAKFLSGVFTNEDVSVDGALDEISWLYAGGRELAVADGADGPSGSITALMKKGIAYLAVPYEHADTLEISLGDKVWTLDLTAASFEATGVNAAITDSAVEVRINLPALGMQVLDYDLECLKLQVKLSNESGSVSLDTAPIWLIYTNSKIKDEMLEQVVQGEKTEFDITPDDDDRAEAADYTLTVNNTAANADAGIYMYNISTDHTQQMELTATFTIHEMTLGAKTGTWQNRWGINGLGIWLEDGATALLPVNIYPDSAGSLKLRVLQSGNSNTSAAVDLGVTLGQTFELKLIWSPDNTLTVNVNGTEAGTIAGAIYSGGSFVAKDGLNIRHRDLDCSAEDPAKYEVSNASLRVGQTVTAIDLSGADKLGSVSGAYASTEMSADSSTEAEYVLSMNAAASNSYSGWHWGSGTTDHTREMELTQTVTIHAMSYDAATTGNFQNRWAANGMGIWIEDGANALLFTNVYPDAAGDLYLKVLQSGTNNTSAALGLGVSVGETFVLSMNWATDNTLTVSINGSQVGSIVNAIYTGGVFTGADCVSVRHRDIATSADDPTSFDISNVSLRVGETTTAIDLKSIPSSLLLGTVSGSYAPMASWDREDVVQIDHNRDLLLEQELRVETMAVGSGGCSITVSDAEADAVMKALLTADTHGKLYISGIALGKQTGERFKLGLKWNTDDSLDIYVDGSKVGSVTNATTYGAAGNRVALEYADTAALDSETGTVIRLYAASLTQQSLTGENGLEPIVPLNQELSADVILENVALDALTENITLPDTAHSAYLGTLPLAWSTDDAALTADGTVTRPEGKVGRYVNLTLAVDRGSELWTAEAYVLPTDTSAPASPELLGAPFTALTPTVDGSAADEGWSLNTRVMDEDRLLGRFGAQWDMDNLYLAVQTGGLSLNVTLNDISVELTAAASGKVTEIAVPFASFGINANDYGVKIPAKVEIGTGVWEGTIVLTSNDWFTTDGDGETRSKTISVGSISLSGQSVTANQGITATEDGYRLFDLYDPAGSNPTQTRTYLVYGDAAGGTYGALNDASEATYLEFDLYIRSMPAYTVQSPGAAASIFTNYGLAIYMTRQEDEARVADCATMGIVNTAKGLVFAVRGTETQTVALGKEVGDLFRIGIRLETDSSLTLFVDGAAIANIKNVIHDQIQCGSNLVNINLIRNEDAAESRNDDIDLYITNVAIGKSYGDSLLDSLTFDTIKGENTNPYSVTTDLELVDTLTNDQLTAGPDVTWESSEPEVIDPSTGKVTRQENGILVTLTAAVGGETKDIEVYVKGTSGVLDVLIAENDLGTATGAGQSEDIYLFTLDTTNNSVIRDLHSIQKVNVIALKDADEISRLNESVLTVWVSNDNVTYTQVDSFKLLHTGQYTYLYGFEAEAQYIKVHCTHFSGTEADFTAPLQTMIDACWQDHFGAEGGFESSVSVTVSNPDGYIHYDDAWTVSKTEAGVTGSDASIRVYQDGQLLYHYVEGDSIIVRIPKIAVGCSAELTVLSGNDSAMDIANKEAVCEVIYGTKEGYDGDEYGAVRWICALGDGVLFNCRTVDAGDDNSMINNHVIFNFSYDGGMTWTDYEDIECTMATAESGGEGYIISVGGVTYDPDCGENGRIIIQGISPYYVVADHTQSFCQTRFIYSDDLGKTWQRSEAMVITPTEADSGHYVLSYTDPIILSTNDGDGPNVDYILPLACLYDDDMSSCARVAYTRDAGVTWILGEDEILYDGGDVYYKEGGVTECTILERADGVLVLYGRCQFGDVVHFARSYSYDGGLTWVEEAELGDIYTDNTQPMMYQYGDIYLMTWAGNNVLGGNSYARYPMNVAHSTDGLMTFENIQDLYSLYSLQGLTTNAGMATNQTVEIVDDRLVMAWGHNTYTNVLTVSSFTDYFFRTKGAYDSFEDTTVKYEGWSATGGMVTVSGEHAMEGTKSMLIAGAASAARSIPYLQSGTVAFDLYLDSLEELFELELESAYGTEYGLAAPIALRVEKGQVYFGDSDEASGLTLNQGWNRIVFELDLTAEVPSAVMRVGGAIAEVPVNSQIGDYICYVDIRNTGVVDLYLDAFQVTDADPVELPGEDSGHLLEKVEAVDATYTEEGNLEYYVCTQCGKAFWDAEGTQQITDMAEVVIPVLHKPEEPGVSGDGTAPGDTAALMPALLLLIVTAAAVGWLILRRRSWLR